MKEMIARIRQGVYEILERDPTKHPLKANNRLNAFFSVFLVTLICLNVAAIIAASVAELEARFGTFFAYFEIFSVAVFSVEYLLRLWTARNKYGKGWKSYFRYVCSPMGIIDLFAVLPFFLPFVIGFDFRALRILRILRLLRVKKLVRYSNFLESLGSVLKTQKEMLQITILVMVMLILLAATSMYFAENAAQPDKFTSIPATLWWAVATLTTIGYGDVYPITPLGRVLGGIIAVIGIGMIALPSGIITSGLVDENSKKAERKEAQKRGRNKAREFLEKSKPKWPWH